MEPTPTMDTTAVNSAGGSGASPPSVPLNALLDRLLSEVEAEDGSRDSATAPALPAAALGEPAVPGGSAAPVSSSPPPPSPPGGGASLLGGLLANPALLSALPTLAENLGPLLGGMTGGVGSSPRATRPHTVDRHTALLCAVKPYLSPQRQNAAETVIRLCRIWDALERSGISLSGLLSGMDSASTAPKEGEVT